MKLNIYHVWFDNNEKYEDYMEKHVVVAARDDDEAILVAVEKVKEDKSGYSCWNNPCADLCFMNVEIPCFDPNPLLRLRALAKLTPEEKRVLGLDK